MRIRILIAVVALLLPAVVSMPAAVAEDWRTVRLEPRSVEAAATTFAYAEVGDGPLLLLLNGTASPMSEWDPALLAALAASRRVIVFDYPGLGLSGPAPGRWGFEAAADWVSAFMAAAHPDERFDVLGWSMGGFIAQQLAVRHGASVRSLVLAGTNPGGRAAVLGPLWVQEADSDSDGSTGAYLRTNYPATARAQAAGRAFLSRLDWAVSNGAYPQEDVPASTFDAMVAAEDPWLRSDANARALEAVRLPTLVITGKFDVVTPPLNSRRIAALIPRSRLVLVPGAGHSFLFQKPRAVARTIDGFLAQASDAQP